MKLFGIELSLRHNGAQATRESSRTRGGHSPRDKLIRQMLLWTPERLDEEIEASIGLFVSRGIAANEYAKQHVYGALYEAFISLENKAIRLACASAPPQVFGLAVVECTSAYFLDLRFTRARLLEVEAGRDYIRMMRTMLVQAHLSFAIGLEPHADWMYGAYLNQRPDGPGSADYVDPEIDALTRLTVGVWKGGLSVLAQADPDQFGLYAPLLDILQAREFDGERLNAFVEIRQREAASRYVNDAEGEGLTFFGAMFPALFPVEVLALTSACAKHRDDLLFRPADPFAASIASVTVAEVTLPRHWREINDFVCGLEGKQGLPPSSLAVPTD